MSLTLYIFTTLLLLLAMFQIALALAAPFGRFAWGGQHEILPKNLRLASLSSIAVYIAMIVVAMNKAGVWNGLPSGIALDISAWIIFGYLVLSVFMNAISRSKPERYLMTPVVLILAVCAYFIAVG